MKLSQCKLGEVVIKTDSSAIETNQKKIGHIVGLGLNPSGETVPQVKFAGESPILIHNNNISLLIDGEGDMGVLAKL